MKGRVQCLTVLARGTRKLVLDHHFDLPEPAEQNRRHQVFLRAAEAAGAWAGEPGGAAGAEKDFAAFDRDSAIVVAPREDLLFFIMGDGDYEELTLASILQSYLDNLRLLLKQAVTEKAVLQHYAEACLVLDEMLLGGLVDTLDFHRVRKNMKMKVID